MTEPRKTKWLIASCGIACSAALLAFAVTAPGKNAQRVVGSNLNRVFFRTKPGVGSAMASPNTARVVQHYGQLPLAFEPSLSQSNSPAKFQARGNGYALFLTNDQAVLELRGPSKTPSVVQMELAGANSAPNFTALEALPGKSNYLIGNDPKKWHTNVPQFRKVMEHDVYPGVNLVYYGTQGQLEYDFDVTAGVDPSVIRFAFKGAKNVHIDPQGALIASTPAGDVMLRKPVAYQEVAGAKRPVAVSYILHGEKSASFQLAEYDSRLPLVIDPVLAYSTYLGGNNIDSANAIAVAPDKTAFVAGSTFSANFPTVHALQANAGGNPDFPQDAFVAKISADGSTLLYATYLGGANRDTANGIAVDNAGNAYVVGTTLSPDYPVTTGSFNTECGGDGRCGATLNPEGFLVTNAFVTKLNAAGSGLLYSGFIGYYENVNGLAIAVDNDGNAYATGQTSANFTPTVLIVPPNVPPPPFPIIGGFQSVFGGGTSNAFVAKISATGSTILYSSYLGGNTEDVGYGIAVDSSAAIYVTGLTYSTNFPVLGPLQGIYGGAGDAFAAKINTSVTGLPSLVYSTYLGGTGLDQGNAIAIDSSKNVYIAGLTNSSTFTFTPAGFQPTNKGEGDAFVAKLGPTGATISYFTFLGGTKADSATGVAVDSTNNVYVTGSTVSSDFPISGAIFQPVYGGGNADSFVAKLDPAGATLLYSSYLGGTNTELATGITVDTDGSAYVAGQTCSEDFPLSNPLQVVPGGNCDGYVAKVSILAGIALNPAGLVFPAQSLNTTSQTETVTLTNGDNPQTITSIAISGTNPTDFAETNTCGASLTAGGNCAISVSFSPTAAGIRKAAIVITDSAPGSPHVVNLSGNTSTVSLSASSLSFGFQQVGTPSAPQAVTVTNVGNTPLVFSGIAASGDYSETDNCIKAPLQPNTSCVLQVTFAPSAAVATVGAITLTDNGSGSPQIILATGTGILQPQASLSSASLGFANQAVGIPSGAQSVLLTNIGDAPLSISSIVATGDFVQGNTCGTILSANANCVIGVVFTPTAVGVRSGTLTITDNSGNVPGSIQTVQLSGTGLAVAVVGLSTNTLTFTGQPFGITSPAQVVTLTNTGSAALTIFGVSTSGDFAQVNNCPTSVSAGSSCTFSVAFTPTAAGNRFGSLSITDNAVSSPQTVTISGFGIATPLLSITPSSLGFGVQNVSSGSTPQQVLLANTGDAPLTISSIVATGDFSQTTSCGATLAAGSSCAISVTFTPATTGTRTGTLTVTDNSGNVSGTTQTIALSGTGQSAPTFQIKTTTPTLTVPAGQAASYTFNVSSVGGFGGSVALSCTDNVPTTSCSISPNTITPSATATATLTVTTGLRTFVPPTSRFKIDPFDGLRHLGGTSLAWLAIVLMTLLTLGMLRRRPMTAAFGCTIVLLLFSAGCGAMGTAGTTPGTPAGTYQITVTGVSVGTVPPVTSSMQVTLQVN